MTHDKELLDAKYSFSPMSLEESQTCACLEVNAGKFVQLELSLEKAVMPIAKAYLPAPPEEDQEAIQSGMTVSSALRNSTPRLWIFGLMCSSPCV